MPCRAQRANLLSYNERDVATCRRYVECGGLPPLYAVPACRDVLRRLASRGERRLPRRAVRIWVNLRIGQGKPRPKTAAASRRTPHDPRWPGREVNCSASPSICAGHDVPCPYETVDDSAPRCQARSPGVRPYLLAYCAATKNFSAQVTPRWLLAARYWYDWRLGTQPERLLVNPKRRILLQ